MIKTFRGQAMLLAERLRKLREEKGMSLDDLAREASISKTYLWELERDAAGQKKPSADVLLRIAKALSTTLAALLDLPAVRTPEGEVQLPPGLQQLKQRMEAQQTPLSSEDLRDLATFRFRGGQPQTVDEWQQLYLLMSATARKGTS
jgi:transcriptional regulator with XRE-family HTH domain